MNLHVERALKSHGHLSQVEAESCGVISILTHFLDLELLL